MLYALVHPPLCLTVAHINKLFLAAFLIFILSLISIISCSIGSGSCLDGGAGSISTHDLMFSNLSNCVENKPT